MASIDSVRWSALSVAPPAEAPPPGAASGAASGSATGPGSFTLPAATTASRGDAVAGAAAPLLSPLASGMLAAQEYGSEPQAARAARRQGMLVLRQLGVLQLAVLGDGPDPAQLARLSGLAAALEETLAADIDPLLRHLLRSLALRARLELVRPQPRAG